MKIALTGGGSGGHFYPLIAIAEALQQEIKEQKILESKLYYIADTAYDEQALFTNEIEFIQVPTGKMRLYFSFKNITDSFKTFFAIFRALSILIKLYPDVVVSKGGYPAFPVLVAAWILRIPIVIHESDMAPGRVHKIMERFAERIAVSFPDAIENFKKQDRVAWTGQPIRKELWEPIHEGANEYLNLEEGVPLLVIYGGSQGAQTINDALLEILPGLIDKYQIIHQTGVGNLEEVSGRAKFLLENSIHKNRYKPEGFLKPLTLKMLAGKADLFITRGGAGSIFDIAMWNVPGIIIPITNSNGDHQRKNAYAYAASGAALVIEEKNLEPHVLFAEIERVMDNPEIRKDMVAAGDEWIRKDAGSIIAKEVVSIALSHQK